MSGSRAASAVSLLFAAGDRPDASAVAALASAESAFSVSHDPGSDIAVGRLRWMELISNGLTYDIEGLGGGPPAPMPQLGHRFGLPSDLDGTRLRAVTLRPGGHLAAGGTMLPVIRTLAFVAARLTGLPAVRAVAWHPARCWSHPEQFRKTVLAWVQGGAFPAFCLAALAPTVDGGMQSEGLALFTGQELRLEPELTGDRARAGKLAVRLLDWLYERGRLAEAERLTADDGVELRLEPSGNGRFVRVWRA